MKKIIKAIKFSEVVNNFIDYQKKRVKESTLLNYESLKNILINVFGNKEIDKIKPIEVQTFFDDFVIVQGMSSGHSKNLLNFLKSIFKFAFKYDFIRANNISTVEIISKRKDIKKIIEEKEKAEKIYSLEDLNKIFSQITISQEEEFIYYFALFTGLRVGEILSLTWDDIDFKENKITVNKNLVKNSKKKFIIDTPKTLSSIREIYLTEDLKKKLKEYKTMQDKNKFYQGKNFKKYFDEKEEINFVFRMKNGELITQIKLQNSIRKIKKIEKDFHFHRLRHSFASHAVNSGIDILYISRVLGHSNINTTANVYSHLQQDKIKEVYQKINLG